VAAVWRIEAARSDGVPRSPAGWSLTVGRRRATDAFRRRSARDERCAALARNLGEGGGVLGGAPADLAREADDVLWDPDQIEDGVLALTFISCHPVTGRVRRGGNERERVVLERKLAGLG
jgi:predicted RNA polymerase sigma factor